jgi:hypothetical protein
MPLHAHLLEKELDRVLLVKSNKPGLQLIVNKQEDGYLIGVFNNGRKTWNGDLEIRSDCDPGSVRELWTGKKVRISQKGLRFLIQASVPSYSFRLYQVSK